MISFGNVVMIDFEVILFILTMLTDSCADSILILFSICPVIRASGFGIIGFLFS